MAFSTQSWNRPRTIAAIFIVLTVLFAGDALAQTKSTQQIQQVWLGYFNQTRLSNHWGLWGDFHLRTREDFFSHFSTGIFRVGGTYYLDDDTRLTLGYAYINHFPGDNHPGVSQPEHRPWQQVQWLTRHPRLRLTQAIRMEERFRRKIQNPNTLADGYSFNFRFRYNLAAMFPLSKKRFQPGTLSLVLNDELHVNFGKQVVNNYFDQNRFFAGVAYHINSRDQVQLGYLNVFQQLAAGNQYKNINAGRVFYFHNLDLRKKSS